VYRQCSLGIEDKVIFMKTY